MANVFISYARRDRERVLALASALEDEGLSVWWDPNLVPGKRFRDIIARELAAADSVVVVWTAASIQSDYVQDEAEEARERGVLVPITLEPVKAPAGFRQVQAADLSQWTGGRQHPEFRMLLRAVQTLVEAARVAEGDTDDEPAAAGPMTTPAVAPPAVQPAEASLDPRRSYAPPPPPPAAPAHEPLLFPRLFDLFSRPVVWLTGAAAVALDGFFVGFGVSGVAAAMLIWAGAMAQACVGAGVGPSRKTTVMVISLGVALIVGVSGHSGKGVVEAVLVGGAVFAGVAMIMLASRPPARRRPHDPAFHAAYQAYRADIEREVMKNVRRARRRALRPRPGREG